jgi:hypothetical protein
MIINSFTINSTSIDSNASIANNLIALPVMIGVNGNSDGFLARRFLTINKTINLDTKSIAKIAVKKPLAFSTITSVNVLKVNVCRKIALGTLNSIRSIESIHNSTNLCRRVYFKASPTILSINYNSLLIKKEAIKLNVSSILFSSTSIIDKKRIVLTNINVNNNCTSTLVSKAPINGAVNLNISTNVIRFVSSRKINSPIINIYSNCGLRIKHPLEIQNVLIQITPSNKIYEIAYDKAPPERSVIISKDFRSIIIPEEIKIMDVFKKQPADSYDYDFSYAEWLMGQDQIESVVVTSIPDDSIDIDGLKIEIKNLYSPDLKLWISGGKNGMIYKVTLTATTVENRVKQSEFKLKIKDI